MPSPLHSWERQLKEKEMNGELLAIDVVNGSRKYILEATKTEQGKYRVTIRQNIGMPSRRRIQRDPIIIDDLSVSSLKRVYDRFFQETKLSMPVYKGCIKPDDQLKS